MRRMQKENIRDIRDFVGQIHDFQMAQIPSKETLAETYQLSDLFYHKMDQMISRQRKRAKRREAWQGIAAAAAVVLLLTAVFHAESLVDAGESLVWNYMDTALFQFEWNTDISHIPRYKMEYVPKGYELLSDQYYGICGYQVYSDPKGNRLYFFYMIIDVQLDIESKDKEFLAISGNSGEPVYYLKAQKEEEESFLVWESKDKTAKFNLSGTLTKEELLKIQDSVEIVPEGKGDFYEEEK